GRKARDRPPGACERATSRPAGARSGVNDRRAEAERREIARLAHASGRHRARPERGAVSMSGTSQTGRRVLSVISALFLVASPWVLYVTLSQDRVDIASLTLIGWVTLRAVPTLLVAPPAQRLAALRLPAIAAALA